MQNFRKPEKTPLEKSMAVVAALVLMIIFALHEFDCSSLFDFSPPEKPQQINISSGIVKQHKAKRKSSRSNSAPKAGNHSSLPPSQKEQTLVYQSEQGKIMMSTQGFVATQYGSKPKGDRWLMDPQAVHQAFMQVLELAQGDVQSLQLDSGSSAQQLQGQRYMKMYNGSQTVLWQPRSTHGEEIMRQAVSLLESYVPTNQGCGPNNVWLSGRLVWEDLEGGYWKILCADDPKGHQYILRDYDRQDLPGELQEVYPPQGWLAKLPEAWQHQKISVVMTGIPVSPEGNVGYHMAGPYYQVLMIIPVNNQ